MPLINNYCPHGVNHGLVLWLITNSLCGSVTVEPLHKFTERDDDRNVSICSYKK